MTNPVWLRPADCALLHGDAEAGDPVALRLVQRLLEIPLTHPTSDALAKAALEEIASAVRAEQAAVLDALPQWRPHWFHSRRAARQAPDNWPRTLLGEVLDRQAAAAVPPGAYGAGSPVYLAVCLGYRERPNRVLLLTRPGEEFQRVELEYGLAAGYYLGLALEAARTADDQREQVERLHALVAIGQQLVEQRETVPLLEHIAEQAVQLLRCERASIFLWDQARKELVGRPALDLPTASCDWRTIVGVVSKTLHSGQVLQVDDVRSDPAWYAKVDTESGFKTRNLLCVRWWTRPATRSASSR